MSEIKSSSKVISRSAEIVEDAKRFWLPLNGEQLQDIKVFITPLPIFDISFSKGSQPYFVLRILNLASHPFQTGNNRDTNVHSWFKTSRVLKRGVGNVFSVQNSSKWKKREVMDVRFANDVNMDFMIDIPLLLQLSGWGSVQSMRVDGIERSYVPDGLAAVLCKDVNLENQEEIYVYLTLFRFKVPRNIPFVFGEVNYLEIDFVNEDGPGGDGYAAGMRIPRLN